MALQCGADLVLDLPTLWASASAERFANAGVSLLASTHIVDTICYGAEQPDSALMQKIVRILNSHSSYNEALLAFQKQGLTFPASRARALSLLLPDYDEAEVLAFLSAPNNILALEYEKAIAGWNATHTHQIEGYGIKRIGGGYHDETLHQEYSSATAIRNLLLDSDKAATDDLHSQVPPFVYEQLIEDAAKGSLMDTNDFSAALYARLWTYRKMGYTQFADCSTELSNKIINHLDQFTSFTEFAMLLKTREVTYTRVCRVLIHILLDIRQDDYAAYAPDTAYLRILGFRRESSELLSAIKKEASLPLVTKMADASHILSTQAAELLRLDIAAADLYRSIRSIRLGQTEPNEFTQPLIIL